MTENHIYLRKLYISISLRTKFQKDHQLALRFWLYDFRLKKMLYTAFIFGLISSFHCVGMCGPIAMMLPVDRTNQTKKAIQIITYHLGRLMAYATIGFGFGLLGKGFFMAGC